jgi:hypothetical protein
MTLIQWLVMAGIGAVGLVIQIIVLAAGGAWKLSRVEKSLLEAFGSALKAHRDEVDAETDQLRRELGETITALRAKITEIELYCRDTFVRRESFYEVTKGLADALRTLGDKLEARMDRFDSKLDRISERSERRDDRT